MINLMPDEAKVELRAARTNVLLIRYISVIFLAFVFLVFVLGGSYYLLMQTKDSAQKLIEANDTKASVYSSTQKQIDTLSSQLSGAKTILNQEVLYSKVLVNLGQQMPSGTLIDQLTLNDSSFTNTSVSMKIYAKSTNAAVSLRDRFQKSPYFKDVNFQNITESSQDVAGYPVTANLTFTLTREIMK